MVYIKYNPDDGKVIIASQDKFFFSPDEKNIIEVSEETWKNICTKKLSVVNGEIVAEEFLPTVEQYDRIMEDYLKEVRVARGYTLREPSDYKDDPNPRFAQDAIDWINFRSAVMVYGLEVQNTYTSTGEAPSLEEFRNNLPTITWTYND